MFVHVLIILVIAHVCVILESISEHPSWVCNKIPKYVLEDLLVQGYAWHDASHATASDGLLGHSLVKLVAI